MKKLLLMLFSFFWIATGYAGAEEITFENDQLPAGHTLTTADSEYHFMPPQDGVVKTFQVGDAAFNNLYGASGGWNYWAGFGYSNMTDTSEAYFPGGEMIAIAGMGALGSNNYGVAYQDDYNGVTPTITFDTAQISTGLYVTNSVYAYYTMKNGGGGATPFGPGDWFKLTIEGKDAADNSTGTVTVDLAVGTEILDHWLPVDLSGLGVVKSLEFTLTSSDVGPYGMWTPAYFCIDNINPAQPIPTLSEWGMIIFSILLLGMTLWIMRKRKSTEAV